MAVFEGARLRTGALPNTRTGALPRSRAYPARARAKEPASLPVAPRVRPAGVMMAAVVAATMVGMVYLSQTLGSNAMSKEIRLLEEQQVQMTQEVSRHAAQVLRKAESDDVAIRARQLGLKKLPPVVVLKAP